MWHLLKIFVMIIYLEKVKVNAEEFKTYTNTLLDMSLYEKVLDPKLCEEQLQYIRENPLLSLPFLDAGIRLPKSILEGNNIDLGNYYQCLGIKEQLPEMIIEGKYCMLNVPLDLNIGTSALADFLEKELIVQETREIRNIFKEIEKRQINSKEVFSDLTVSKSISGETMPILPELKMVVCIPRPCTTQQAVDFMFPTNLTALGLQIHEEFCRLPNDKQWVPADSVALVFFSILAILTLLSTSYDINHFLISKKDPKEVKPLCVTFSVYTNCRRLLNFNSNSESLQCLDGIRAISIAWIVVGHTYSVVATGPRLMNILSAVEWMGKFSSVWILATPISVDTFFMLSGLLVVYTTAAKMNCNKLLGNIHLFYLHRILRMFPILATAILLEVSLWNYMYDGPLLETREINVQNCRNNWWAVLLYVQNYVKSEEMCLAHTWYLAIDMQLHILSPIILFCILYNTRTAWLSLIGSLLSVMTAATIYCFLNDFPGNIGATARPDDSLRYVQGYYYNTLTRSSPFIVGMCIGYLLHRQRGRTIQISKIPLILLWICAAIFSACVITFHYYVVQFDWDNQTVDSLMNSFMRPAWATAVGWMIFACVHGYGGPINWFLSLSMWKLPSRISYAVYIFHYPIQFMAHSAAVLPYYFSDQANMFRFLSEYSLSFIVAFFATLLIDAPFSAIFKILLQGGVKKTNPVSESNTTENTVNTNVDKMVNVSI